MAQRSRKRGRREKPPAPGAPRRPEGAQATAAPAAPAAGVRVQTAVASARTATRPSRSEIRNAAARATLTPLAPGERPWAVTVSAILAALVGGYNLVSFLLGDKLTLQGRKPGAAGIILFALIMFACAAGMWRMRYWAVLGFQALLAIILLIAAMLLITVANLTGLVICLGALSFGGLLFYKLVKALGRMQLPAKERS